jgi:hypothetical protein
MEKFPKIARARMTMPTAGPHPEAEQLNAFAENALVAGERETVLSHLAVCGECREIVALSAAARPEGSLVAKPARGGFRWATFQWAAVAASVAIVTIAALVVGPHQPPAPQRASEAVPTQPQNAPAPVAEPPAMQQETRSAPKQKQEAKPAEAPGKSDRAQDRQIVTKTGVGYGSGAGIGSGSGGGIGGGLYRVEPNQPPVAKDDLAKSGDKKEAAAGENAPREVGNLAYASPGVRDTDSVVSGKPAASANLPPPTPRTAGAPSPALSDGERAALTQSNARNQVSKNQPAANEAALSSSTESVEVQGAAPTLKSSARVAESKKMKVGAVSGAMVATRFDSASLVWRVAGGQIQSSADAGATWQPRSPASNVPFTTVAASGQQLWAGGKAGALYVSPDNDQNWKRVSLTGDDTIPLGDVTAIKIGSASLVDVILSTGDDWQSTDGGKSYRLVPRKP